MIANKRLDSGSYAVHGGRIEMLDTVPEAGMMSVYCTCGRIVPLDRSEMRVRLKLGKKLECMSCRNARISHEIDVMNDHFNGIDEPDASLLRPSGNPFLKN